MHSLLQRQVRRFLGEPGANAPDMARFLAAVDLAYSEEDGGRALLERSLEIVSGELIERNRALQAELRERASTEAKLERRARQQEAVARLAQSAIEHGLDELLASAALAIHDTLGVDAATISEQIEPGRLRVCASVGQPAGASGVVFQPPCSTVVAKALARDELIIVDDYAVDSEIIPPPSLLGVRSALAVPVHARGGLFGLLSAYSKQPGGFSRDDVHFVTSIASLIGGVVDRARAREQLTQSEERYRTIVETAREGIAVLDADLRITYVNNRLCEMLARQPAELVGRRPSEFVQPGATAVLGEGLVSAQQRLSQIELPFERKDGGVLWAQINASSLPGGGAAPAGVLAMFRDLTARKRMEDELRESETRAREAVELIERLTADAIITIDRQRTIASWNDGAARMFGWSREEAVGRHIPIVPPEMRNDVRTNLNHVLDTGQTVTMETTRLTRDGRRLAVFGSWSRIRRHDGGIGVLVVLKDLSALRAADEQLNVQANVLALMHERERIAMDLHDGVIQSLYGVVLGLGARQRSAASDGSAYSLNDAIAQLNLCIGDLRSYIYGLRSADSIEPNLADSMDALINRVRLQTAIPIRFSAGHDARTALKAAEASSLLQIAREALSNAVRHANASSLEVCLQRSNGYVELRVSDDGRGFETGKAGRRSGDGLGNMARRAKAMNAHLCVRSQPGQGTSVELRVPVAARPYANP